MTGICTSHPNLFCMAFAGLIVGAGRCVAGNLSRFAWNVICVACPVIFTFTEAFAAGLVSHFRIAAAYTDVILTAGIVLIIGTVNNRTV